MGFKQNKAAPVKQAGGGKDKKGKGNAKPEQKRRNKTTHDAATDVLTQKASAVASKSLSRNPKDAALHTMTDAAASSTDLRESLASLYELAAGSCLHSAKCRPHKVGKVIPKFPVSKVVTKADAASTEQLWGQLNVVFTPVLKTLIGALEADGEDNLKTAIASSKKKQAAAAFADDEEGDEEDEEMGDEILAALAADNGEDEEEDITFGENDGPKQAKKAKKEIPEKDKWKYAFGVGNDAFDDDEEEEEDEDTAETRADRRRNANNEGFGDDGLDDGFDKQQSQDGGYGDDDDFDGEENEEDDEAAMKEMYGEDAEFDPEDQKFGGEDDDEDAMDDLELLDEDEEGQPQRGYDEDGGEYGNGDDEGYGDAYGEEGEGEVLNGDDYNFDDDGQALDALSRRKKVHFDENGEPSDPTAGRGIIDEADLEGLSGYERNELKRKRSTQDLEESRLFGKDWTMSGETAGKDRGRDVLLDEKLEFDHAMRQIPVITEQVTKRLELRIKKRIIDNHFDDVERRSTKTVAADLNTTKRDEGIDAQKSKHSLMDLYEKDYLAKQKKAEDALNTGDGAQNAEPLTEIEKDELKAIAQWKRLSQHLDALSNFFYTPKPVQEDVTARVRAVDNHAPAIAMEAVGVLGVQSKESAVAPQDLFRAHKDKFVGVSKEEMDPMEKQALRRAKKNAGTAKKERMEQAKIAKEGGKRRDAEKAKIQAEEVE